MRARLSIVATLFALARIAHAQHVLPPGLEDEIGALVLPGTDPAELVPGVVVSGVRIERAHIDVTLARGDERARVRLVARGSSIETAPIGETPSFTLAWAGERGDPGFERAAAALHRRIAARDRGGFFEASAVPARLAGPGSAPTRVEPVRPSWLAALPYARLALWITLLIAALLGAGRLDRGDLQIVLWLFVTSLALRVCLPPWAPLHANDHGITELRGLLGHGEAREAVLYGSGYRDLLRVVLAPTSGWAGGPLVFGAIAGSLAPPLLFLLATRIASLPPLGAAAAGAALAIQPAHIRLSLSESAEPLAGTLFLLGLVLATYALEPSASRRARALACVATACAWALAADLRVTTLALPAAGVLFVIIAIPLYARPPAWALALAIVLVLGMAGAHVVELEPALAAAAERSYDALAGRALRQNVLFDPTLTPWMLMPLAGLGGAALWMARRRRLVIASMLSFLVVLPPSLLVLACRTDAIRYQSVAAFFPMLMLVGLPAIGRARPLSALFIAALLGSALPGWLDVVRPDAHAQAYAIARDAPPPSVPIRILPIEMAREPRVRTDFPDYAIEAPERVSTAHVPRCRAWIGVACWSFAEGERATFFLEPGMPFRHECVELLGGQDAARRALARLRAIDVPHRGEEFHRIPAGAPRVGYAPCPDGEQVTRRRSDAGARAR